jgi:ABC-type glycerol-3-phosphate transport system substrate-binding protein
VGGDCIEYVPTADAAYNGGYWEFTLMDATKNYVVADGAQPYPVGGNTYTAGQILSWQDKVADVSAATKTIKASVLDDVTAGKLIELPSQREAFVEFVRFGQKSSITVDGSLKGYGVCPAPTSIGGDSGKTMAFATGKIAMLIDGRWNVPNFRSRMDGKYTWDVAPLPVYRKYDNDNGIPGYDSTMTFGMERQVAARGREAGHSGSVAVSIASKSKYPNAAWKFIEYIGGRTGQTEQAKTGFAIPSQKDIAAQEDIFLQTDKNPKNSKIFLRAAEIQTPGDWWYLYDKKWIDPWAGVLNGDVRNGTKTLTQFENSTEYTGTNTLLKEYTKKKQG